MKRILALLLAVTALLLFDACEKTQHIESELSDTAAYQKYELVLGEAEFSDGSVRIHATFTNGSRTPLYVDCCFWVRAYQNGEELLRIRDTADNDVDLVLETLDGGSLEVTYAFLLVDSSPIEVTVEPIEGTKKLAKKVYGE